jgi:hypothetical protein
MRMPEDPLALPQPRPRRTLWITLAVIALTIIGSLVYHYVKWKKWEAEWVRLGPIEATGGLFVPKRIEIPVPLFRQNDDRWGEDVLAKGPTTLAQEGCAVSSAAMVLASYGLDTDPGRLNKALTENDGYEGTSWIRWEKAAEVTGNFTEKAYEDLPSYQLIDLNLQQGNPVIVRVRSKSGGTHFVVIVGKDGYDYLTRDPGAGGEKGVYPLKEYGSKIEALRFYRRLKQPSA